VRVLAKVGLRGADVFHMVVAIKSKHMGHRRVGFRKRKSIGVYPPCEFLLTLEFGAQIHELR
jgi:hypothetical protein